MEENKNYDVVIIGGSYAGLSAAMSLGRAIRKVLMIDNGKPCNIQTPHSHNFITHDGNTPAIIAAQAKAQVMAYPTIRFLQDEVTAVQGENNQFIVSTGSVENIIAGKILFTTGVKDLMPDIPGLAACWGISVIHCPYCHGYEYRQQRTGIMANGDIAFEFSKLVKNWTNDLTIFTNGKSAITTAQQDQLSALGINIVEKPFQKIEHQDGYLTSIVFTDGEIFHLDALYAKLPFKQHCTIPENLGCVLNESGYIQVDAFQKTSVPGIYAAGDNTTAFRSVALAVSAGSMAGAFINKELVEEMVY
ncbi:NAD(P)/FAD-dependent oxidoreductase [Dyadobacter sp. NIV53]|uniref:NAD(P)/FAD-dependent oxidoreductase n=1 Tax=Dyadobacter sp. NIV53 TaxID=2861765 RepID=UPI001C88D6A3|nr:NAD(P)/FAD-dependent oxidoreductase [Dyadobacter sp. NIV53]